MEYNQLKTRIISILIAVLVLIGGFSGAMYIKSALQNSQAKKILSKITNIKYQSVTSNTSIKFDTTTNIKKANINFDLLQMPLYLKADEISVSQLSFKNKTLDHAKVIISDIDINQMHQLINQGLIKLKNMEKNTQEKQAIKIKYNFNYNKLFDDEAYLQLRKKNTYGNEGFNYAALILDKIQSSKDLKLNATLNYHANENSKLIISATLKNKIIMQLVITTTPKLNQLITKPFNQFLIMAQSGALISPKYFQQITLNSNINHLNFQKLTNEDFLIKQSQSELSQNENRLMIKIKNNQIVNQKNKTILDQFIKQRFNEFNQNIKANNNDKNVNFNLLIDLDFAKDTYKSHISFKDHQKVLYQINLDVANFYKAYLKLNAKQDDTNPLYQDIPWLNALKSITNLKTAFDQHAAFNLNFKVNFESNLATRLASFFYNTIPYYYYANDKDYFDSILALNNMLYILKNNKDTLDITISRDKDKHAHLITSLINNQNNKKELFSDFSMDIKDQVNPKITGYQLAINLNNHSIYNIINSSLWMLLDQKLTDYPFSHKNKESNLSDIATLIKYLPTNKKKYPSVQANLNLDKTISAKMNIKSENKSLFSFNYQGDLSILEIKSPSKLLEIAQTNINQFVKKLSININIPQSLTKSLISLFPNDIWLNPIYPNITYHIDYQNDTLKNNLKIYDLDKTYLLADSTYNIDLKKLYQNLIHHNTISKVDL